jgi:phage-related tail fiber protein
MIDANSQFFAILTNVGMAKQANADALGIPWLLTQMGVGDANPGGLADPPNPIPSAGQSKLLNEWRRKPLNQLKIDPVNPAVIIAEQIIPADEGGKWIREIGLYDADGDLVAVANCAPSFKPNLAQGSGRTQIVRINFVVTNTGNIQLKIDPAVVLASRAYVDAAILEVLPKNKTAGEFTRLKVNDRGVVVSGDNPDTLAKMGIKDSYTKDEVDAMTAQATEIKLGTAKIATQAMTDAGTNDAAIVTPKKLRWGFSVSINGGNANYIIFPSWLGGLMIQWGATVPIASGANLLHAFPVAFASALPTVVLSYPNNSVDGAKGDTYIAQLKGISLANMTVRNLGPSPAQYGYIAIGR